MVTAIRPLHLQHDRATLDDRIDHLQAHLTEGLDGMAIDRQDPFTLLDAGRCRGRASRRGGQHRRGLLQAGHAQHRIQHDGQKEVGSRTGDDDGRALEQRQPVEGAMHLGRVDLSPLFFIEHAHVAAQRNGRQAPFGLILANFPGQQRLAEADGEAQDLDATPAGHQVVTQLVHEHQHAQGKEKGNQGGHRRRLRRNSGY